MSYIKDFMVLMEKEVKQTRENRLKKGTQELSTYNLLKLHGREEGINWCLKELYRLRLEELDKMEKSK